MSDPTHEQVRPARGIVTTPRAGDERLFDPDTRTPHPGREQRRS
jgi:hypothetical protein